MMVLILPQVFRLIRRHQILLFGMQSPKSIITPRQKENRDYSHGVLLEYPIPLSCLGPWKCYIPPEYRSLHCGHIILSLYLSKMDSWLLSPAPCLRELNSQALTELLTWTDQHPLRQLRSSSTPVSQINIHFRKYIFRSSFCCRPRQWPDFNGKLACGQTCKSGMIWLLLYTQVRFASVGKKYCPDCGVLLARLKHRHSANIRTRLNKNKHATNAFLRSGHWVCEAVS